MKKRSDKLEDYELFFEEIGSTTNRNASILNEEIRQQRDYDEAPSLSESQVSQLAQDLQQPMDHPEDELESEQE